jgi:CheY-like chemotaxis protein
MAVSDVDLAAVLRNCLQLLKSNVPSHVSLQLELLRKPCPFRGDWSQIVQSILNLVTNAVEAVGDQPGQILLRAGRSNSLLSGHKSTPVFLSDSPASGPFSWVEVEDTGCGIAPELAPRMFEPFYSTRFTGRGLGLPSVLGTVRSHEGGVAVFSKPGEGTVVRLAFPCAEEAACSGHSAGRTILVVDDEEPVLEVTVRGLEKLGMETISATHGEEAVEKLRQAPGRIDAAIIDLTMPRMDGQTTLKALREIRPDLPAVMISGYSSTPTPLPHSGGAPLRFLAKPFRLQTLEAVLDAVLANR